MVSPDLEVSLLPWIASTRDPPPDLQVYPNLQANRLHNDLEASAFHFFTQTPSPRIPDLVITSQLQPASYATSVQHAIYLDILRSNRYQYTDTCRTTTHYSATPGVQTWFEGSIPCTQR
ncbi:hypothetical protein BC938DRAFT_474879 [Jimgerdemannia flammicorona]|uniref:Uncharacterized protein n=1 Tax=Jimgerdemannia flammicorona TaxID=994334 RepID=A0A433Q1C8_9FUNG|nr:hypothetical protein BC938DRAFT_474879 [Jimgerdemannia flammicorona]